MVRVFVVVSSLVALLSISASVNAEVTRRSFQLTEPLLRPSEGRIFTPLVPLMLSMTTMERAPIALRPRMLDLLDQSIRGAMLAPSRPLYCYGPACAPTPFVVLTYLDSLGGAPAAISSYFIAPPKLGPATYRFGLVSAVGGPAVGLKVRW